MSEDTKIGKLERALRIGIPFASVVVALVALLIAVAARKKELTCIYTGSSQVASIDPSGLSAGVKMEFNGVPITSLYKQTFRFKNTGAAAVKREDVRDAINLHFPSNSKLLYSTIEGTNPQHMTASTRLVSDGDRVTVDFPLLNSGEEIDVAVYLYNSEPVVPEFEGRVVDVKQVLTTDNQEAGSGKLLLLRNTAVRRTLYWVLVPLYSILAALSLVGASAIVVGYVKFKAWHKRWGKKYNLIRREVRRKELKRAPKAALQQQSTPNGDVANVSATNENDYEFERIVSMSHDPGFRITEDYFPRLLLELKEKGIPQHPHPFAETFAGMLGGSFVLLGIAALFAITAYLSHFGLRS